MAAQRAADAPEAVAARKAAWEAGAEERARKAAEEKAWWANYHATKAERMAEQLAAEAALAEAMMREET
jgi:hypothetical protein